MHVQRGHPEQLPGHGQHQMDPRPGPGLRGLETVQQQAHQMGLLAGPGEPEQEQPGRSDPEVVDQPPQRALVPIVRPGIGQGIQESLPVPMVGGPGRGRRLVRHCLHQGRIPGEQVGGESGQPLVYQDRGPARPGEGGPGPFGAHGRVSGRSPQ